MNEKCSQGFDSHARSKIEYLTSTMALQNVAANVKPTEWQLKSN